MFNKFVRWCVWSLGGLVLLGMMVVHFSGLYKMPDYLVMTLGICFGMYMLMFVDTIIGEMVKIKRPK
jgi:hypothetical protein